MRCVKPTRAGFTLAEVLAALAFMSIVIPVAVQGISVASRAGQVAARKADATRIGDRVLNELEVTGQLLGGAQNGVIREGEREFRWSMQTQSWLEGNLNQVTVSVAFEVQGQAYDLRLATLIDPNAASRSALMQ
jgi:prepilin-type N-terminal cleavage/methylation domain-containing protein